jgi:hypothetical protein
MQENLQVNDYMADLRAAGIAGTFGSQFVSLSSILQHLPVLGTRGSLMALELRIRAFAKQRLRELRDALTQSNDNMKPCE